MRCMKEHPEYWGTGVIISTQDINPLRSVSKRWKKANTEYI